MLNTKNRNIASVNHFLQVPNMWITNAATATLEDMKKQTSLKKSMKKIVYAFRSSQLHSCSNFFETTSVA